MVPETIMTKIGAHIDDIVNKKKVGELNCFEYKSPLEIHTIEDMIKAKASIQEMAVVLEGAQCIIGYRVDRLHHDVRQIDSALSSGNYIFFLIFLEFIVSFYYRNCYARFKW